MRELDINTNALGTVRILMMKGAKGDGVENVRAEIAQLKSAVGSPLKAATAAGMTDTDKIYVYTGSESGYTSGHWYYWSGSAWTDGGVYNSVAVSTDDTLSVNGAAADSAAVGNTISKFTESSANRFFLTDESLALTEEGLNAGNINIKQQPDGGLVLNGTVGNSPIIVYLMGARNGGTNIPAGTQFVVKRTDGSGSHTGNSPVYRVASAPSTSISQNTPYVAGYQGENLYIRIPNGASYTDQVYYFHVVFGEDSIGDYEPHGLVAVDASARKSIEGMSARIDDLAARGAAPAVSWVANIYSDDLPDHDLTYTNDEGDEPIIINYTTKFWRMGDLPASGSDYDNSNGRRMRSYYRIDTRFGFGVTPVAVKMELLSTSALASPYLAIGYKGNTILASSTDGDLYYEFEDDTTAWTNGPVLVVGDWENAPASTSTIDGRLAWLEENLCVTFYYPAARIVPNDDASVLAGKNAAENYYWSDKLNYIIRLPEGYAPFAGVPTPLLVLSHGLGSTLTRDSNNGWEKANMRTLVGQFVAEGYAVIDVQRVTTQDWCNPALIRRFCAAINDAVKHYNVVPTVLYGESMGSLIALNLAARYNFKAMCIAGMRLDFDDIWENIASGSEAAAKLAIIKENLGVNGHTEEADREIITQTCPTMAEAETTDGRAANMRQFPPAFYLYGDQDQEESHQTAHIAKVHHMRNGGNWAQLDHYDTDHTGICYLQPEGCFESVMAFFEEWGGV